MVDQNPEPGFSKVCYYELLGVDKKATENEIKKGYIKMSRIWHPDKNLDKDTTKEFQRITEAHECLKDTNERAWYDSHRD